MNPIKRLTTSLLFIMCMLIGIADDVISYVPVFHGALRPRWEMDLDNDASRFQVKNARVIMTGYISPAIDYFVQTDLCDQGKMKILDVWGRLELARGLNFQAGQFRMPFGVEPFRAPTNYIFANRSVIGKEVCNVRAVGAKVAYTFPFMKMTIEGGAFNPTSIADHNVWVKTLSYAAKADYTIGDFTLTGGFQTIVPDEIRINLIDAAVGWNYGRWTTAAEYMNKHYTHESHPTCHAYNIFVDYTMPVKAGIFNQASFQGRFDGMTDHSSGSRDDEGNLSSDDHARNRITIGATLSHVYRILHADFRINYEKFFYQHGFKPTEGGGDRLVAELVIRF